MKIRFSGRDFSCFLIFMSLCFLLNYPAPAGAAGQPGMLLAQAAEPGDELRDPQQEINKKVLEKLRKMGPDKVEALDNRLAEALNLYYDGKYGQALPIFNEIATEVQNLDVMWWIGTSAMRSGELALAVKKFQAMLAANPGLHRVRLELAATYFEMGRYMEAKKELDTVKATRPPEEVQKKIDLLLAAIDDATRKVVWNIRFSQGFQYDTNVSAGPDKKQLDVSSGTLTLDDEGKKIKDTASITSFGGNALYKINTALAWNTSLDFYQAIYFHHGKFNYLMADISTGPWWTGRQDILKVPFGVTQQEFESESLSHIVHIDPSYEHFFNPYFSLRGAYRYSRETFDSSANDVLDNVTRRYEINPNFYLANRRHIVSLTAGWESSDAEGRRFSYDGVYYGISYFTRFPTGTEVFLRYQWWQKDYKEKPVSYDDYRVDRRHVVSAVISQEFYKHYFTSFAFNYIDNYSSTELYRFEKETYTINVGFYF